MTSRVTLGNVSGSGASGPGPPSGPPSGGFEFTARVPLGRRTIGEARRWVEVATGAPMIPFTERVTTIVPPHSDAALLRVRWLIANRSTSHGDDGDDGDGEGLAPAATATDEAQWGSDSGVVVRHLTDATTRAPPPLGAAVVEEIARAATAHPLDATAVGTAVQLSQRAVRLRGVLQLGSEARTSTATTPKLLATLAPQLPHLFGPGDGGALATRGMSEELRCGFMTATGAATQCVGLYLLHHELSDAGSDAPVAEVSFRSEPADAQHALVLADATTVIRAVEHFVHSPPSL